MTDVEPVVTDFAATGRTGRRNAVPDIVEAGPADLSDKLAELSVVDDEGGEGSSSGSPPKSPTEGEEKAEGT
ncbi:cAMP-dependent protein kinase inhibitor beta [Oncorhynchus nerka]|uniref:cAMP-dependent protein kinase inhibitor n=1 Tax=Oncorhynchus mykiss TaxID=8022 RepID=A0A060VWT3_ONCMY|nr:cAMP-dependent protein kinase inhibitor alpha-like [Oncorhynchus kisutch]XP_020310864.1 cAMP-dependent protein kinase inhibitor alpha-like [Oncorhynchus kisutch]XP_020310865.1 cAMP-dependent protein kinase inhibitor alpha-like [Oncorhynchus kisutch]XP_021456067.1 cAMP-dependent protein kinase inhibitor beta [Oncorhynchus mykiss]XP_021456068.1 cAMP-dependent protein kinase inhibitor beta [Oncorhynchus mykiss]XP_024233751.1 cAMP-dependent protein kinase inhibitor beta [Oncorhynchus tshawytsch